MGLELTLAIGIDKRANEQHSRSGSTHKRGKDIAYSQKYSVGLGSSHNIATQMYAPRNDK